MGETIKNLLSQVLDTVAENDDVAIAQVATTHEFLKSKKLTNFGLQFCNVQNEALFELEVTYKHIAVTQQEYFLSFTAVCHSQSGFSPIKIAAHTLWGMLRVIDARTVQEPEVSPQLGKWLHKCIDN